MNIRITKKLHKFLLVFLFLCFYGLVNYMYVVDAYAYCPNGTYSTMTYSCSSCNSGYTLTVNGYQYGYMDPYGNYVYCGTGGSAYPPSPCNMSMPMYSCEPLPSCTGATSCGTYPSCYAPDCAGVCGGSATDYNGSAPGCGTATCSGATPCGSPGSCYATYCDGSCTSGATDYNGSAPGCGTAPTCTGPNSCGTYPSCYAPSGCNYQCGSTAVNDCAGICGGSTPDYNGGAPGCGTAPVASGSISALGCTVPVGSSSCTIYVSWSSSNVPLPRMRENGSLFSTAYSYSNYPRTNKTPATYTYTFQDNTIVLDTEVAQVVCASGSTWNGLICQANTPLCTAPNSCGTHPSCYAPACNGVCGGSAIDYNGSSPGCGTPASCTAQTINNCVLQNTSHMNFSGSCTTGYGGDCSYLCNDGSWEITTTPGNTCTPLSSPTVTSGTRTVDPGGQVTIVTNPQGHTGCYLEGGAFTPITGAIGTVEMSHLVTIDARTTFTIVCDGGVRSAPITIEVASRVFES